MGNPTWAKKSPLAALLVATSIYLSIFVLNAMVDPSTIMQGFIVKIIVVTMLYKGIKSALELKQVNVKN